MDKREGLSVGSHIGVSDGTVQGAEEYFCIRPFRFRVFLPTCFVRINSITILRLRVAEN